MSAGKQHWKTMLLAVLIVVAAVLAWKNLIQPARQDSPIASASAAPATDSPRQQRPAASRDAGRREKLMDQQELAALDPTLRLDLLGKTAKITYQGGSRNIFQFYTPPPQPITDPIVAPPQSQPQPPVTPPPPTIALKFYGTSSHPGTTEKRAFLTDGEEIYIAQEGEVVAKRYKIARIGMNSLEWEDMQTHQRGQLPLVEE
ncbi:MAG: hypothetical protein HYX72_01845 [Acidobacteria bacterium]|nr:hypothetical protein [Acidobacteriota bacterium]